MRRRRTDRRGQTLLEMAIAAAILVVTAGAFVASLATMRDGAEIGDVEAQLQLEAARALDQILDDLRVSGFVAPVPGGPSYPYFFQDGRAEAPFHVHAHPPASKSAKAHEPDYGPSREIVLLLPADADGDGVADLDRTGGLVWGGDEVSYVHVTRADGTNVLERRVNGGAGRAIAENVERVVFDDAATSGSEVARGAIRVRIHFRVRHDGRPLHRWSAEAIARLRNP